MPEYKRRPWSNPEVKRKTFEEIVQEIFQEYKDNMLISKDIADEILHRITTEIRRQLKGL
jgi:signal recognition particle GTPase